MHSENGRNERGEEMKVPVLAYKDGYKAGQYDAENGQPLAYVFDQGDLQPNEWKQGYEDGKLDYLDFACRRTR